MTNKEAIEFLKNMIDRELVGFIDPKAKEMWISVNTM